MFIHKISFATCNVKKFSQAFSVQRDGKGETQNDTWFFFLGMLLRTAKWIELGEQDESREKQK